MKPLSPRQLAGQLLMIRLQGTELDDETACFLRDNRIRAVCLFRNNMVDATQLSRLTSDLRKAMGDSALIAIDQEGGAVARATWLPAAPSGMALGAADDPRLCREVGAAVARGLKSLGFNWNFAPVLDLNNNLDNPVIAERSFGAHPQRAAGLALAWMEGSLAEGVSCCVKHFPGHGDTHVDSHRALPTVNKSREALEALEFAPFRAAVNAPAMMSAHIVYTALDPDHPATLSRRILTGLLRDEWHYQGVIITDGMDMQAIAGRYGAGPAAVQALEAGADMVMALGARNTQQESIDAIAAALEAGRLAGEEIAKSIARLDRLAHAYPAASRAYVSEAEDRALMARAWQRALTAYRDPQPLPQGSRIRLVARADVVSDGVSEASIPAHRIADVLRRLHDVDLLTYENEDGLDWAALPDDGRTVILASTTRLRYGEKARRHWRPDLHLVLWNPILALDIDAPALLAYGYVSPALEAIAAWLAGAGTATGKCPLEGFAPCA
jgi:beta-N-acetylhexosaminidase